jgi:DNA-binding phage protein
MSEPKIDWKATMVKWHGACAMLRLNMSEVSEEAGVSRQHLNNILASRTVPSVIVAERIDRAIDACVERRKAIVREAIHAVKEIEQ